ncbi:MAG: peptidoglycan bridge formation glycyltransferase FemA/FemB family protein [Chloroflexi bacterium]|nr:peptidoglycan bridge formation glycyltransferase FemA/FemB family protein [Chloroflexota bacterium]
MTLTRHPVNDKAVWNDLIKSFATAHILQSWEWGAFKQRTTGWTPERWIYRDENDVAVAAVSLLTRTAGPFSVIYAPKGPLFAEYGSPHTIEVIADLAKLARQRRAIWLKIDPDIIAGRGIPKDAPHTDADRPDRPDNFGHKLINYLKNNDWRFSDDQPQFRNTFYLDLTASEDDILTGMNQSTRRKIRQAENKGVTVRPAQNETDLKKLYDIYDLTSERQDFIIRPEDYYLDLWSSFQKAELAHILIAEVEGQIVGGVVLFHFGERVWYFYGMSTNQYRDHNPNHALQWEAIRRAKAQGYKLYDWWGAPDEFHEGDPMWGVYRFKDGFGGEVIRHIGAWDYVPFSPLYFAYTQIIPRIISFMKRRN